MSKKLRDFVRLDGKNIPVTGSNIRRPKKPTSGLWMEIEHPDCCGPTITYTPSFPLTDLVVVVACNASTVLTVSSTQDFTTIVDLVNYLNNSVSVVGHFTSDSTIVSLKVDSKFAKTVCAAGTLTMTLT